MTSDLEARLGEKRQPFKSEGERRIADYLESCGIRYEYERGVLVLDRDKPKIWHPDFYLPEFAVYLEYFGLAGNEEYDSGVRRKIGVYREMSMDVVPVYPWTFCDDWQGYILQNVRSILQRRSQAFFAKKYTKSRPCATHSRPGYGKPQRY